MLDTFHEYLQKIAEENGSALSTPNENSVSFACKGCNIIVEARQEQLYLYTALALVPQNAPSSVYERLLEENFLGIATGGGIIGLHKISRILAYSLTLEQRHLDEFTLRNALYAFATAAQEKSALAHELLQTDAEDLSSVFAEMQAGNIIWG